MTEIEQNTTVDERLRDLYNKSRQLREYSQWLKRRSDEPFRPDRADQSIRAGPFSKHRIGQDGHAIKIQ